MNNLGDIIQLAMYQVDEPTNPATGQFSIAWWTSMVNKVQDILAHETGYYQTWQGVDVTANVRTYAQPSTLCWGIVGAQYWGEPIAITNIYDQIEDVSTWRTGDAGTPLRLILSSPNFDLDPMPDMTVDGGGTILAATAGGNFSNQPTNDGVEVVSQSASDTTQTVTVYGTTYLTSTVVSETITLTGVTAVASTKTDWGDILGVELSAACAGTITIREASGDLAITTITGGTTAGITAVTGAATDAGKAQPLIAASGTSTAKVAIIGTDEDVGALTDNCVNLCGTAGTTQRMPKRMGTITKVLLGAVASAQTVTVTRGYALELLAGTLPSMFNTPATLAAATAIPTGLPRQFWYVLVDGVSAFAEIADLYDRAEVGRMNVWQQAFWNGVQRMNEYLGNIGRERSGAVRVDTSAYTEFYRQ